MAANRMFRFLLGLTALGMVLTGCGRKPAPAYQTWATPAQAFVPAVNSPNAFDDYALAALEAEQKGDKNLTRVSFFPGQRKAAAEAISAAVSRVSSGTGKSCEFRFVPHPPFQPPPFHKGWRLIGRVFAWRVEDACKAGDYPAAVQAAVAGSKFGFDLTGGGAMDVSLGLSIVDDIRRALASHLDKMPPEQLAALEAGMSRAADRRIPVSKAIENERLNMLMAVQTVQDLFQGNKLEDLRKQLGPSAKEGIDYLQQLTSKGDDDRAAYFKGFAQEADVLTRHYADLSSKPARDRVSADEPNLAGERPWRRLARHFFGTLEPLLAISDATTSRTRLLILSAGLYAKKKAGYPSRLANTPSDVETDPYSGQPFLYHADAAQFQIYSVGSNLKDDGGETDATFSSPDLFLEESH